MGGDPRSCCPRWTPSRPAPGGQVPTMVHTPAQAPCCSRLIQGAPLNSQLVLRPGAHRNPTSVPREAGGKPVARAPAQGQLSFDCCR